MILVIDNYDSFTYNLVQYLGQCGAEAQVVRNDQITLEQIAERKPSGIMLSPGPCTPRESAVCLDVISEALKPDGRLRGIPVFGVCLGHQSMGFVSGGDVRQAKNIMHGKASMIEHDGKGVFGGMPNPFSAIRYHSLIVTRESMPEEYEETARSLDDGEIMGMRHKTLPIEGVQFHPESILTEQGMKMIENWVAAVTLADQRERG